ncbi:lipopolysaccharide assembly protein LapA domain-containing protein [Hydrogenobacter sp. T-2]|uniref:lipopolysaccharide assembly protein LapA domain-containing protein n=1 Tax=Pampinifervens diazotrophicum TaxID=1632018 RepID=UPI002B25C152|nr:lipopolysaccharide assembly protein LapA domain-containing protein [Hydrogenobacter sp. T-2]WPM33016.1 lipopolysaccharide assembly protein LapA domain-containing protein [Hydrogenobacter sp. T-2]
MSIIKLLVLIAFLTAFLLFIAQNAGYVEIRFFHIVYNIPLFVLLLFTFAFGFLLPSFYLLLRVTMLKRRLHGLEEGLRELSRGYLSRAERLLFSAGKFVEPARSLVAEVVHKQGKLEELKNFNSTAAATVGEIMLREGNLQEAERKFDQALLQDGENLRAIKGLRNLYALSENWERALEYQEKVLQLCEKWEREKQKGIKAEIMAMVYLKKGEERLIEKAFDLNPSPFVYSVYIKHLLSQDRIKDARKVWEKAVSMGYQEEVLWNLLEDEKALTKLLDDIEAKAESIDPNVLCVVYLNLNLISKAKNLEEKLTIPFKALLYSSQSHKEQDKYCLLGIKELLKPFVCSCGKAYNTYKPLCVECIRWGEIKLRRDIYAGRP